MTNHRDETQLLFPSLYLTNIHYNASYHSSFRNLSIYLSIYGSGCFFNFLIFYAVGRTPSTGDEPVARPLPKNRTAETQNKRTHRHPCLKWVSNPRCSPWSEFPLEILIPFVTTVHKDRDKLWFINGTVSSYNAECRLIDGGWIWKNSEGVGRGLNYVRSRFLFEDTERNSRNHSEHNRCLTWISNLASLEYKSGAVLWTQPFIWNYSAHGNLIIHIFDESFHLGECWREFRSY
jgi:hypothetical protein